MRSKSTVIIIHYLFPSCELIITTKSNSHNCTGWLTKFSPALFIKIDPFIHKKLRFLVVAFQRDRIITDDWLVNYIVCRNNTALSFTLYLMSLSLLLFIFYKNFVWCFTFYDVLRKWMKINCYYCFGYIIWLEKNPKELKSFRL